jgi:hypothetical protein
MYLTADSFPFAGLEGAKTMSLRLGVPVGKLRLEFGYAT